MRRTHVAAVRSFKLHFFGEKNQLLQNPSVKNDNFFFTAASLIQFLALNACVYASGLGLNCGLSRPSTPACYARPPKDKTATTSLVSPHTQ